MKQQQRIILVYGTSQKIKAKSLTSDLVGDISYPAWYKELTDKVNIDEYIFICTPQAYIPARKKLSNQTIIRIDDLEDLQKSSKEQDTSNNIAAVRIGDVTISKRYHPSVEQSDVWMSPYHLELIRELFQEGFVIEVLDERNNPIIILGDNK